MSDDIAISVDHVSKVFRLPHERQSSIKSALLNVLRGGNRSYEKQLALSDVSVEIKKGEFFGIVGRNGSGKSTLLKLLAGIYSPTRGHIHVEGKLTPFIELGVGFNPELTGKENVFLNGALLGFSRKEMEAMYADIVKFAELEKFMDQKLKNYSSGMQVRLAFSIAIRAKSDILILDEVLAVGDEAFQRKCIDIFEKYKAAGQTVVLVTHDMETVRRFCSKAILLKNGEVIKAGEPNAVATAYSKMNRTDENALRIDENSQIKIELCNANGKRANKFQTNDFLQIRISWPESIGMRVKNVGLAVLRNSGENLYGTNTIGDGNLPKNNKIQCDVKLAVGPGKYHVVVGLFGEDKYDVIEFQDKGPEFIVDEEITGKEDGLARLAHKWNYEN
jgi:ABC-type polysaccharide/polyol phosphate transport system ATPase subunit